MHGYSGHTFKLVNKEGKVTYTQWHYRADKGFKTLTNSEAGELAGSNPDYGIQGLFQDIEKGDFPSWTVYVVRFALNRLANELRLTPINSPFFPPPRVIHDPSHLTKKFE